jgi:drug/metabolite transporter (DMT)-like permease
VDRRRERAGLIFAALCAANGASVPAFAKLTTNLADPVLVATATTLVAALCAGGVLALRGELRLLIRADLGPWLFIVGVLGTAVAYVLLFLGTQRSTAIDAVICLQSEPAYALLAAWLFLGHRPTVRRLAAATVLLGGIFLALGGRGFSRSSGMWILLATPLCWQTSHLVVLRRLRGLSAPALTGARYIDGGIVLALYWMAAGGLGHLPPANQLLRLGPLLAFQGTILFYVGTLLWYAAIARLDLARATAIVVPTIPLLSLLASFLLLGEIPTIYQSGGLVLTAAGVVAFVTAPDARKREIAVPSRLQHRARA